MVLWQLLRARGALQTTRDRTLGHGRVGGHAVAGSYNGPLGAFGPLHYAADAAHGSVRTFSMGPSNKMTMQDLNLRLASYMDEIQALEAANETLEMQIKELLDRKSPSDLINLDRYLDTVNTLHSQITESQIAEAQTKLQLVSLVLVASDLSARVDVEQGKCVHLQANLRDLRLVGEQMWADALPCLSCLVSSLTEELSELQAQHLQNVQHLRAQVSGDISMQLSCAESSQLSQQLEMFRDESLNVMIDKNQAQNNSWFNTQASMLTCKEEETPPSSGSEVFQTEMNNLRMTKLMLEEELTKLQTQQIMLEESDLDLMDGYSMQLAQLQQRADGLALQLSSIQQATSEQAEEYQALLHIKSSLEREIEDYTMLLDMKHNRTLSSSYQTMTSAIPLNVQTSCTAFQSTAMMEHDRRILAQTRPLWNGSELKVQESRIHMSTTNHPSPVAPTSALHISVSPSTPTSNRLHQVNLAEDAPRKYPTSVTSISTSGLLDQSLTPSENKIQSITKESQGTCAGSQEGESKIARLEMKKESTLLESQYQSQQTPTKNTAVVEPRGVQEITGTALDRQMTKQVTNTVTEIVVKNTIIEHTKAAKPETHTISDCPIPMITAIENQLENQSLTSSENKIQSITKESQGTCAGSQEGESKIARLEMKKESTLLESQYQSQQTPTKNTAIVEPRGVQEITGTALDRQMTKQVTNTVTEIIVKNTIIEHTKAAKPETHIISDCPIPMITAIENQLENQSLTSSENKIQSITKESQGTCAGSQEGESKIARLEMKKESTLLESQYQSQQTPTKNTAVVEPRGVQEITGTALDRQMTKQVTNTVTEIVVKNTIIEHTKAAKPETHIISDCPIPTITAIENQLDKEHDISPKLSITSCNMQVSERSGIQSNVCQIDSVVLNAAILTGTTNTDSVGESTVVDLNISEAQRVTSIERPTEEEIQVGNNTSGPLQGNTQDICQKSQSVEITAVGNHLEKAIQEITDGDALGQAQSSLDDAHVSTVADARVRMESNTYSTEDTSDQIPGTVVKLQASTVTEIEDNWSNVGGNAEGVCLHSSLENKAENSFAPLLASALRIKEEAEDVEKSVITSHGSSDDIGSINHTPISENNPISAITDKCPIIEKREGAVELDNAVPQVQSIEIVEKTLQVKEVEKGLSTHYALSEVKIDKQEEEEGKEIEAVDTTLHTIDSLLPDLPKTIHQGDQVHKNVEVVYPNLDSEATVVVEVNQTDQETSGLLIETETRMSSVDTVVGCEAVTKVNLSQTHPDQSLSPEDTEMCLSPDKTLVFSSTTTPGVSEVKLVTKRDSDFLLSQTDPHTSLSQKETTPVDTNENLNQKNLEARMSHVDTEVIHQNELDICFSPVDGDVMTQNEFDTCFSPVDNDDMTQNELEMCFSPVDNDDILRPNQLESCFSPVEQDQNPKDQELCLSPVNHDILNQNELEACMSPVDNRDIMSPNQFEGCYSPVDNNDVLSQNELDGCFSPVDIDLLSPNDSDTCFSPVDNDILSPNRLEACLSPDTNEAVDVDREECFSPSDDVCMSPTEEKNCSPVKKYILSTKAFKKLSGKKSLTEKDKASKVNEPRKEGNSFKKALSSGFKFISKTKAGSRDEARNRSIEGTGQNAFSPVGSPPDNRNRKLSLGDREDTRFHSITRGTWGPSSNKSLDGKSTGLTATRMSSGSSLTNEKSHCFRSVPTRGASFNYSTSNTEGSKGQAEGMPAVKNNRVTSPGGRIFSGGSGEWKLYGGSVGRTSNAGSASGSSVGSGGRVARSGSGDRISHSTGSHVVSSSRRYGSMGSGESKPVYSSASGRISSTVRQSGVPGATMAPSPSTGRKLGSTGGSGGRLSSAFGGSRMSGTGSAGKHSYSGSNDRLSGGQALRISSTAGQVRTNSTGGRMISSSDRPGTSVGSGVGTNKERISVCKRAALSISAAGRERSQEKRRSSQRIASANNPRIQHWVTTGVGGTVEGLDDQDDILNL